MRHITLALLALCLGLSAAQAQTVEAARALPGGSVIEYGDVVVTDRKARRGEAQRLDEVVGMQIRSSLYRGRPVRLNNLSTPTLVERNALVEIIYRSGPLSIRGEGRAMNSGGVGERVRVMNLDSRLIVTGRVKARGQIEVSR